MGPLGYPLFLRVNLLFRKFVGCGGPKLTGGASGRGVLRGTFGPGPKKKKKKKEKEISHFASNGTLRWEVGVA